MPNIAKNRLSRRNYKKNLLNSIQKAKATQTSGSVFADRIEQFKKTKIKLELIKSAECFPGGHDNCTNNFVSVRIQSL